ncbi:E3 ubiquitin-protein ligase [Nymphaea thermarum]|nr:E3 ubiquitin-protein ligase [Nymphaea thermarum]
MSAEISDEATIPAEPSGNRGFSRRTRSRLKRGEGGRGAADEHEACKRKTSLSSMLLSLTLGNTPGKNSFRGFGCTSAPDVFNPSSAHSSVRPSTADWEVKKARPKPVKASGGGEGRKKKTHVVDSDVWCAPGIPFSTDADSVDCVVSRRPAESLGTKRSSRHQRSVASDFSFDVDTKHRERLHSGRPNSIMEHISELDPVPVFETLSPMHYRHLRGLRRTSGDLAELVMLQTSLLLGGVDLCDQFRDWRLDVDSMTYEELLELGDKIGYVSTGLNEDQIARCLMKMKHTGSLASHFSCEKEKKCSICQEEYEGRDEVGKLECGHNFHMCCIKQWLLQKNACPVCKAAASHF